ncbi:hypothetical protein GCM10023238_03130 [Streptomyces heliomycini]
MFPHGPAQQLTTVRRLRPYESVDLRETSRELGTGAELVETALRTATFRAVGVRCLAGVRVRQGSGYPLDDSPE